MATTIIQTKLYAKRSQTKFTMSDFTDYLSYKNSIYFSGLIL